MKSLFRPLLAAAIGIASVWTSFAADMPVKRETRSAWVATVWQLDWPSNVITSTGNESQIKRQKDDLIKMLDSLSVNNMNAVNFQVRSRSDAMYKSSYEPWSTDLVSQRGLDPGWDPLEFCVAECHARGMECHAWVNPYRFESVQHQWDNTPMNYRETHPEWVMDVKEAAILNPGNPEVTKQICDIIAEIVTNYDVDGVLFDDYFYLSGTPASADADLYSAYQSDGGALSLNDWRRDNVNKMIDSVYKTIKSIKPWVRFGVSPAGIACTSSSVARKYGISPCPTGSDWQYNDIYSDPIAWISNQSLDFISPQIYWTIGYSTDYNKAAKWWSEVAAKWDRHFYSSHSISSLTASSKAPGMSLMEEGLLNPNASGPNNDTFEEYANQIRLNREYTLNDAPGSIFYSCKYLYKTAPLFAHYLKTTVFNSPALLPAMTWFPVSNPGNPSDVTRGGSALSWTGPENVRYTVYAVPSSVDKANFNREVEYLLGTSYSTSYTIPDNRLSGYNYAVCTLDRYGNEYSPVFVGEAIGNLDAPTLLTPTASEYIEMPFDFKWSDVTNASNYIIEIAADGEMKDLLYTRAVNGTSVSSSEFYRMPIETQLFWRVRSCGNSYNDGVSAVQSFTPRNLQITSPESDTTEVSLTPTIEWAIKDRDVTLQLSTTEDFKDEDIILEVNTNGGSYTVPAYKLAYATTYYARMLYVRNGENCSSPVTAFTTLEGVPEIPTFIKPAAGGVLHADEHLAVNPIAGVKAVRFEVSSSTSFPSRSSYIQASVDLNTFADSKAGSEIKLSSKGLVDGQTYYVRARNTYMTADGSVNGEYSAPVEFIYSAENSGVNDIVNDDVTAPAKVYDLRGIEVNESTATPGLYIRRQGSTSTKVVK